MRVALAQLNLTVGDLSGNAGLIAAAYDDAVAKGARIVVFPELAICGYPPEDLVLKPVFVARCVETLEKLAARTGEAVAVIGFPEPNPGARPYNAAAVCRDGRVEVVSRKQLLPNYSVFDEERYFTKGDATPLIEVDDVVVGPSVCEDIWSPGGPPTQAAAAGAAVIVNINASPYHRGRQGEREAMLAERARQIDRPIVYVNLVGGQDELIFDGASVVVGADGEVVARAAQFETDLLVCEVPLGDRPARGPVADLLNEDAEVYGALVLGTRDYVRKNGFDGVLVGLSGGIDSALVAAIAADALGPKQVTGVLMPSRYSSEGSVRDAEALVANLGIRSKLVPIEPAHVAFAEMLGDDFTGIAEENTQARIRGTTLMALSNRHRWLVLTTGNKSEMAVGYATLYGDMAGGYAVIKDVFKTQVYRLARWRNETEGRDLIPRSILDKAPSAELAPGQLDTDSLPPYGELDLVLEAYVEERKSMRDMESEGFDPETVRRVVRMVDANEYKRRQAPPGVRVSPRAFGKDRRLPITNRWSG